MSWSLRTVPEGGALVEITSRVIQGRYLLRPDANGRVNELVLGVIGRAQELTSMPIVAISVLSTHFHILAAPEDAQQMAKFMKHAAGNISDEIGRLHDWPGSLFVRRYKSIEVSTEEEDQVNRLRYILAAGVKEGLVERAIDWPGVHSARALTRDQPLRGWWFDRSQEYAARRRGENFGRFAYATEYTIKLSPLPCWAHLSTKEHRRRVKDLVCEIERETAAERNASGAKVLGAEFVMAMDPHHRPARLARSPAPKFHARRKRVRRAMWEAYAWVVAEHRKAAERLLAGDRNVRFPEGTFPPGLPFVPYPTRAQPP